MIILWVFLVGFLAVGTEAYFRATSYSFWQIYPFVVVVQAPLAYGVYRIVTGADQYLDVLILFPLGTMIARALVGIFLFKEIPTAGAAIAIGLVVLANVLRVALKYT